MKVDKFYEQVDLVKRQQLEPEEEEWLWEERGGRRRWRREGELESRHAGVQCAVYYEST